MSSEPFILGSFDVAIAGAGLAGASLALQLARRGVRVALLDPGEFPRDKLCGEYLSPETWSVLHRLDLADKVAESGYHAIRLVRITTPRGSVIETEVAGPDGLPGIGLSRSFLDNLIVREAGAAGAQVFERTRVSGPVVRDGGVVGLHARHPILGACEVQAAVTIAANGRSSVLVRQTGRTRVRSWLRPRLFGLKRHLAVFDANVTEPYGMLGLHLVPGGYGGTCRIEEGVTNLCALLPESAVRRQRGNLDRVAANYLGRNPALARLNEASTPAGDWKTVAGVRVEVSTPRLRGILYAGDCQGTVDPLGGQGMAMALRGAELLVPFVERALISGSGADATLQGLCQAAWHHRFDRRVFLCGLLHHALVNPGLIDAASTLGALAPRILNACFRQTRDPEWVTG